MQIIRELQKEKMGKELSKTYFSSLVMRTERILNNSSIGDYVAVLTYGSAGDLFLVSNSDTDFTLLSGDSNNVSGAEIAALQSMIMSEFDSNPWDVSFKAWNRIKVNPMDLLSVRFICGNRQIYEDQVIRDPIISSVLCEDTLISILSGNDLALEFMSLSKYYNQLFYTYHAKKENPVEISYGDAKYYTGCIRWLQDIYMIAMIYSHKRFLADIELDVLVRQDIFTEDDLWDVNCAADFFLTVKDLCMEGTNILYDCNLKHIEAVLGESVCEITAQFDSHSKKIQDLSQKAHESLIRNFPLHKGVLARTSNNPDELYALIDTDLLDLWRTIALRRDIPAEIREKLADKIRERQKVNQHAMLDEMMSMLQFASITNHCGPCSVKADDEKNIWVTDQVIGHFKNILKNNVNNPDMIRKAVKSSFLPLYKAGKFPDIQSFYAVYFDRLERFFHSRTLFPDEAVEIAKSVCMCILESDFLS